MSEADLISKIRALRARGLTDKAIRRELGLAQSLFYYLLGRGGLRRHSEGREPGKTHVIPSGDQPGLWVSRKALRQLGWKIGQKVRWRVERGRLIGEPVE